MSDFKLANTVISNVKLGGSQVSKIYNGNVLVWPKIPYIITGEDPFGGDTRITGTLEYSTYNLARALDGNGNSIAQATNSAQATSFYNAGTPCWMYWNFDPGQAYRGYLYNTYASEILAPSGWRVPISTDMNYLIGEEINPTYPNINSLALDPATWTNWTNRTGANLLGWNAKGYGGYVTGSFIWDSENEVFMYNIINAQEGWIISQGNTMSFGNWFNTNIAGYIRICRTV